MNNIPEDILKELESKDISSWQKRRKPPRLPYGYKISEDDPEWIEPVPEVIQALEFAFDLLDKGTSTREVSDWLSDNFEKISHVGLRKLWMKIRPETTRRKAERGRKKPRVLSRQERMERNRRKKIAREKQKITFAKKKIERLADEVNEINEYKDKNVVEIDYTVYDYEKIEELEKEAEIIFKPNPGPQTQFLAAPELEVLYGGAAGGGKSFAMLADPMRWFGHKEFNGLLLRRTNDELRELIWKSQDLYPKAYPGAIWREKDKEWRFPSGARLWMTYLERDEDVRRYQGQAFTWIGFDELTQYSTPFAWEYLRSRLRSTDPVLSKNLAMRATTNPGGPGHGWVKKMFIDPAPFNKPFWATNIDDGSTLVNPATGQGLFRRRFIPAKLDDNPYLDEDGIYRTSLLSLPEQQRRQLLEGDWTVADGAAFGEFSIAKHVIEPIDLKELRGLKKFRSCDFGYSSFSAVHWYAIDNEGTILVYRELYTSKKTGKELAHMILELERDEKILYGVLDSSVWSKRGEIGPSIAEEMIAQGCRWRPSDRSPGSRVAGKNRLHELLKINPDTGKPGILFFDTCRQIIADLPVIPMDPRGGEDIDDKFVSDHAYDSIRYGIMSRPRPSNFWDVEGGGTNFGAKFKPSDTVFGY